MNAQAAHSLGSLDTDDGRSPNGAGSREPSPTVSAADAASIPSALDLPDFPFFEVNGPTAVFGCKADAYLCRNEGSRVASILREEAKAFSSLFFRGGRLTDHGFKLKPEFADRGMATIRALMCSFAPPHEAKEGTVALALHRWCDRCEPTVSQDEVSA